MAKRGCEDVVRTFGGGRSSKCGMAPYATISGGGESVTYCIEHLAANITGMVTEHGEVTVTSTRNPDVPASVSARVEHYVRTGQRLD